MELIQGVVRVGRDEASPEHVTRSIIDRLPNVNKYFVCILIRGSMLASGEKPCGGQALDWLVARQGGPARGSAGGRSKVSATTQAGSGLKSAAMAG